MKAASIPSEPPRLSVDALINPLDALLGYQLRRASAWILADLAHDMADLNLRPTEVSILRLIEVNCTITQSDIGRFLAIKRANMTPLATGLVERGLIERVRADGRSQSLSLTAAGRALTDEVTRRIGRQEARLLPHLTPDERCRLIAAIRSIWTVAR